MSTSGPSTASSSASASSSTSGSAPARSGITAATEWAATLKNPERVARGSAAEQPRQPRQPRAPKLPAVGTFPRPQVAFETPAHEKAYYEEIVKLEPPISMKWMRRMALGGWAASACECYWEGDARWLRTDIGSHNILHGLLRRFRG